MKKESLAAMNASQTPSSRSPHAKRSPFVQRLALMAALTALVVGLFGTEWVSEAVAQRGLRARIYLTQARIPRNLTERGLIGFARRHQARRLQETTDQPIPERQWRANMVTAFNRPVGDTEFQVLFYDIEEGARRFIGPPLSVFVSNRQDKTFVQRIRMDRDTFDPNRRMELVITVRRTEVGRQRFEVLGERIRHSGEVTF